jgi:hypothetical protein
MGGALTPQENFLYLLSELERAVARGTIVWSLELSRLSSFDFSSFLT